MKTLNTLLLTLCVTALSMAQTTLYSENFTGQNGIGYDNNTGFSGMNTVDWDIYFNNPNQDTFKVENEQFIAKDIQNGDWLSPVIDISGFTDVSFSLNAFTSGNLENGDKFEVEYRINQSGDWQYAETNGDLVNDFNLTVSQTGLSGTSLELRIRVKNSKNEIHTFDTILVQGTASSGPVTYIFTTQSWDNDPNGVSTADDDIIVASGNASINMNTICNTITVNPGASLTISNGNTLTIVDPSGLTLESNSTEFASLLAYGAVEGAVSYKRQVNAHQGVGIGAGANDLIASPVISSQDFGAFAAANSSNLHQNPNNTNQKLFGPFDKNSGQFLIYDIVNNENTPINSGVGYRAASNDNEGFTFTGAVNQDEVSVNIVYTGNTYTEWNLVGNPYPAYINVEAFLNYVIAPDGTTNKDLLARNGAAIYGYDGDTSNGWTIWNLNTPDRNITPGQGFFIRASENEMTSADYDIKFSPEMMVIGDTDDFIEGRLSQGNNAHLKLSAVIGASHRATDFYFNDNSTAGLDPGYDAGLYGNPSAKEIYSNLVTSATETEQNLPLAIQSLAYSSLGSDILVPLGIHATQGNQVTISIAQSTLPSNIEVYLEDTVANTSTLLNNSDYVFTANTTINTTGRFFLRIADEALSTTDLNTLETLQVFTTNAKDLVVKGQLFGKTNVQVFDMQGRMALQTALNEQDSTQYINVSNLQAGVYIVKLDSNQHSKTQKVIIR